MSKGKILRKTITDMIKEIKQSRGAYEAKRLERAADEVPNLGRLYKKDALEGLFRGDNARGIMTMRPGDFERYASPLNYDPKSPKHFMFGEMIDPSKGSTPKGLTQEQYLRYLAGLKGFSDVPFLEAKKLEGKKPKLAIAGHEGRHRSRALDAAGEQAGLVQFYPRASLREEFPRRHRDEYIDALREELEKHGRMVTPESDGSIIRPDIELPDVYKGGGVVRKADGGIMDAIEAAKMAGKPRSRPIAGPRQRIDIEQMRREVEENARRVREVRSELTPPAEMTEYNPTLQQKLGSVTERGLRAIGAPAPRARALSGILTGGSTGSSLPFGMSVLDFTPAAIPVYGGQGAMNATEAAGKGNYGEAALELGLAALDLSAGVPATKALARAAKPMVKAGAKALAPKVGDLAEQYMMKTGMALPIIKEGGGNWMAGDVERGLKGLKRNETPVLPITEAEVTAMRNAGYTVYDPVSQTYTKPNPLNQFVDKQIANYVKNQMGTKDDPIRLAADAFPAQKAKLLAEKQVQIDKATADMEKARQSRGFTPEMMTRSQARIRALEKERELIERRVGLHYEPQGGAVASFKARQQAGFPVDPTSTTPYGQSWENISDAAIEGSPYRMRLPMVTQETAPDALRELGGEFAVKNPNAMAYSIKGGDLNDVVLGRSLGFDHMMDEMRNATNIESGLPKELLIDPKNLSKWTMPQVTEHVDKINAWRASQKAEADLVRANNAATVLHKDYPEKGMKWVELKTPEATLPEGYKILPDVSNYRNPGKEMFTMFDDQGKAVSTGATEAEAMRLYNRQGREGTLADALKYEGEQLQHCVGGYCPDVISGRSRIFSLRDAKGNPHATVEVKPSQTLTPEKRESQIGFLVQRLLGEGMSEENALRQAAKLYPESETMQSIAQIKGKGNAAPSEEYLPYVQDFVRSGEWSKVGDLKNTGLIREGDQLMTPNEHADWLLQNLNVPPEGGMKRGGKVRKPVSIDAMRLAVGGMARGGRSGLIRGGIETVSKALRSAEKAKQYATPAKFERAPAKTKAEVEVLAQRMAPQFLGEFVRKPESTFSVAGKSMKQYKREKDLPIVYGGERPTPDVFDITKHEGEVMVGVPGDPTIAHRTLDQIGDIRPETPVELYGGPLYGLKGKFWASGKGPATGLQSMSRRASEAYGEVPVVGQYIRMPEGTPYALHTTDALLAFQRPDMLGKKNIERLNAEIRKGNLKYKFPEFVGFEDPDLVLLQAQDNPNLRKHINNVLLKPTTAEKYGLYPGPDIDAAITEAGLRNLETGATGYSVGRLFPESRLTESAHPTYEFDIPGKMIGQTKYPQPYELTFPDALKFAREGLKPGVSEFGMLKMIGPRQIIDPQYIDEIKMYEEAMKKLTGKKKGGPVKKAGGGLAPDGIRHSGEGAKGKGYFGRLPTASGDGHSTELSVESDRAGEHPLLVPTLTREEINHLLAGGKPTDSMYEKAERYALERKIAGKSPFAGPTELRRPLPPENPDSYSLYKKGGKVSMDAMRLAVGGGIMSAGQKLAKAFVEAGKKAKLAEKAKEAASKGELFIPDEETRRMQRELLQGIKKPEELAEGGQITSDDLILEERAL